ncbi:MAG: hypothetical protein GY703_25820 [Gammaproteobacteria bacterium]|nr:hypothetical protein [Gammaproteobacteria bacterium]
MKLLFSEYPGRRERHLQRQRNDPLFPESSQSVSSAQLLEAQRLDHEELVGFITGFRQLIHEVSGLPPNADSEQILQIKERLDQAYEQSAGLADDQTESQTAIEKLLGMIMGAVRREAGSDQLALNQLAQEDTARALHFELLQHNLVADLLTPDSPITPDELAPTLLSASAESLTAVLSLFDKDQILLLYRDAVELLEHTPDAPAAAREGLGKIREAMEA